jgi:Holliday junction DNA helicase RuvA
MDGRASHEPRRRDKRMIGKLKGLIDSYGEDFVILDVNGVGYLVQCSARTLQALPRPGEAASLSIETQVREDAIRLFGFRDDAEREWFRLLQTVQGVGSKVALAILSTLGPSELATAVASRDKAQLQRAQGVGGRLAERLVSELKDKVPAFAGLDPLVARLAGAVESKAGLPQPVADAISALTNLGYAQPQASAAIAAALKSAGDDAAASQLIKLGLRELSR